MQDEQDKRFVLGEPRGEPAEHHQPVYSPRKPAADTAPLQKQPGRSVWWLLVSLMLGVTALAIYILVITESAAAPVRPAPPAVPPLGELGIPPWIVVLTAALALCQITALLNAYNWARRSVRGTAAAKRVEFWCEAPIYVGFLGSLLAVCIAQFTTGSLAAPLAYLTSIAGIVLYLIGRISIGLPITEKE